MSGEQTKGLPALPESFLPREHSLYRPRHSHRQRTALGSAFVFFCVPLLLLVVGVRPAEFENRRLADFPSVTDGWGFFTGLNAWANDHIPFRDKAVAAATGIGGLFGQAPEVEKRPSGLEVAGPIPVPPKDPSLDLPDPTGHVRVIEGKDDWLFLGQDVRAACEPELPLDEVFSRLNALRAAVESSGRRFVLVVAPNKSTVMADQLPAKYFGAACARPAREEFWRRVTPETGALDLTDDLRAEAERLKTPVYSKLDTHWTHAGGLVMARAVAERIKPGVTRTWKVTEGPVAEVPADLPRLLGASANAEVRTYDLAPDGRRVRTKEVVRPVDEPKRFVQLPGTGVVSGRVAVLGDSFTFYVLRYVVAGFSDVTVQDTDHVLDDTGAVARMLAEQDTVVLEASERGLVGGTHPMLNPELIAAVGAELARSPR